MSHARRGVFWTVAASWCIAVVAAAHMGAETPAQQAAPTLSGSSPTAQATFQRYCLTCHNQTMKARGTVPAAFDALRTDSVAAHAETWEEIVRKVRTGLMPPAGSPRPDKAAHDGFVQWIEGELDR